MNNAYIFQECFQIISCHRMFIISNLVRYSLAPSIYQLVLSSLVSLSLPMCLQM
jgi:hypothetical protein